MLLTFCVSKERFSVFVLCHKLFHIYDESHKGIKFIKPHRWYSIWNWVPSSTRAILRNQKKKKKNTVFFHKLNTRIITIKAEFYTIWLNRSNVISWPANVWVCPQTECWMDPVGPVGPPEDLAWNKMKGARHFFSAKMNRIYFL